MYKNNFKFWGKFRFLKFFIMVIIYHSIFRQFWFIKLLTEIEKCIEKVSFGKLPPSYVEYYSHWTFNTRVDKSCSIWAIQTRNFNLIGSEITPVKTPSSVIYSKSSNWNLPNRSCLLMGRNWQPQVSKCLFLSSEESKGFQVSRGRRYLSPQNQVQWEASTSLHYGTYLEQNENEKNRRLIN